MDRNEIIVQVANDILNRLNIGQIVNVLRDHSVNQANAYYDNLSDEEKTNLSNQLIEAKKQAEEAAEKASEEAATEETSEEES